eukprot:c29802_g1_i1 orf=454-1056(-)
MSGELADLQRKCSRSRLFPAANHGVSQLLGPWGDHVLPLALSHCVSGHRPNRPGYFSPGRLSSRRFVAGYLPPSSLCSAHSPNLLLHLACSLLLPHVCFACSAASFSSACSTCAPIPPLPIPRAPISALTDPVAMGCLSATSLPHGPALHAYRFSLLVVQEHCIEKSGVGWGSKVTLWHIGCPIKEDSLLSLELDDSMRI